MGRMNRLPEIEEHNACDVCHRTMLKGEWAEPYLTPSRERRLVCQLCAPHAQREGWIRESAAPNAPAQPQRPPERRGLFGRLGRRREAATSFAEASPPRAEPESPVEEHRDEHAEADGHEQGVEEPVFTRLRKRASAPPRKPRQVRAVPTNAQLKIDRALDLFNQSEHPRTIAGIARSLGPPYVSAMTSEASAAEVLITVAWELSWYQFTVDLSDPREPVGLRSQGQELNELSDDVRTWNLEADADGRLGPLSGVQDSGEPVGMSASAGDSSGEELP
jgi:hypothetical protein